MNAIEKYEVALTALERGLMSLDDFEKEIAPLRDVAPVETLKAEIYKLKHQSEQGFGNHDYYVGYISALSTVEGILAWMDEGKK